jgi:hypothetical protein
MGIGCSSGRVWICKVETPRRGAQGETFLQQARPCGMDLSMTTELAKDEILENASTSISQALKYYDSSRLLKLLEHDFDRVAQDEYSWLHELVDVGYGCSDIADLLLEEANDALWIYFDP